MFWANSKRCVAALLFLAVSLSGCGLPQPAATGYDAATAPHPPPCAGVGKAIPLPASFPHRFPLPHGTVMTFGHVLPGFVTVTGGFIASRDFRAVVRFFGEYLPLAGYTLTPLRTHQTSMDELFEGQGLTGILHLQSLDRACRGQVRLTVQITPGSPSGATHQGDPY